MGRQCCPKSNPKVCTFVFAFVDYMLTLSRYGVNMMPMVPSAIHQLVTSPLFSKTDLSTLVAVSSGAAYLPPELAKKFMRVVKSASTMLEGRFYQYYLFLTRRGSYMRYLRIRHV